MSGAGREAAWTAAASPMLPFIPSIWLAQLDRQAAGVVDDALADPAQLAWLALERRSSNLLIQRWTGVGVRVGQWQGASSRGGLGLKE